MCSVKDSLKMSFYSIKFLLDSKNQEIMKVGLFLQYNVCRIPSLCSEVVPDLKMGFHNLAVFIVLLLLNLNI